MSSIEDKSQTSRAWPFWGALGGLLLTAVDGALFTVLGIEMRLSGYDVRWFVFGLYALSFAALGYLVGRLHMARLQAKEDAQTIESQLKRLEQAQSAALQAEKLAALGRMAAGIAHEFRNPLGVIRSATGLLQEEFEATGENARACTFILEEIERLDGLIEALLGLARPATLACRRIALQPVLERAAQLASVELRRKGQELECQIPEAPVSVLADPDLLTQALLTLLINALQSTPEGGLVQLRLLQERDAMLLEVADSGQGVHKDIAEQIFEPFFTTRPDGTGLGLAMAGRIVEAHGGVLRYREARGAGPNHQGACFQILLSPTTSSPQEIVP